MNPLRLAPLLAAALLLGLTGCDEEIGVTSRRLGKPPAKGDNDYGDAIYLGHPGEQKLHWGYWRHLWSVEFTGSQGRFVALADTRTTPTQPPGPGLTSPVGTEINPGWEKACGDQGAAGHLLCQYERGELVVGIIDYIRQFSIDKHVEYLVKSSGMMGGGKDRPMPGQTGGCTVGIWVWGGQFHDQQWPG